MRPTLNRIALATLLLTLPAAVLRAQDAPRPARATLSFTNVETPQDVDRIMTALRQVPGVREVTGLTPRSGMAVVTYLPNQVSVQQIAQAVAEIPGTDARRHQASLLIRVTNLKDPATAAKTAAALKGVTGIATATVSDPETGVVAIQFGPLAPGTGLRGVTYDHVSKALTDAGLTLGAEVVPTPAAG